MRKVLLTDISILETVKGKMLKKLLIYTVIINILFSGTATAEEPEIEWTKILGPGSGACVQQTTDGGYIVLGASFIKTDNDGNILWEKPVSGNCFQQTPDGGYIIVGGSLIKTDSSGNILWEKSVDGSYVQLTEDGGFIIAGRTIINYRYASRLTKTNASGNKIWEKSYQDPSTQEWANCVQQTSDGGYVVAGHKYHTGMWVFKTDSSGNKQWGHGYGGTVARALEITEDNGFIIAGDGGIPTDIYLTKTNSLGNTQWQKTFGGADSDFAYSLHITDDNGYIMAGLTNGNGQVGADLYVLKTGLVGNMEWEKIVDVGVEMIGYSVWQTFNGEYIVTGLQNVYDAYTFLLKLSYPGPSGSPPSDNFFLGEQELSGSSSDPINTATGNFIHGEADLSIASRGMPLEFSRYYNSKDNRSGPLGIGWTYSYDIVLTEDLNLISVRWGDGRTDYWRPDGQGGYEPDTPGLYDTLLKDNDDWIVTKKNLSVYIFDANGRLQNIKDKNGNTITLSYSHPTDPNLVTAITDPAGRTLSLEYTSGLLTSLTDFDSPARTIQYNYTSGQLTQATDILGNTIDYTYDSNGYLSVINNQRNINTVTNIYDATGRVIQQADGNGNITTFAYDTPVTNQTTITDPCGNTTIHTHYTGYKLLLSIKDPLNNTITYTHDDKGNRTSITDRNGNTTSFSYDDRGNVTAKTDPNAPTDPYDGGVTVVEYNDVNCPDLPTKKTDALGNVWSYEYDANGNLIRQADPNDNERTWTYNSFGQKLTETDENGNTATYTYDADGLLTEVVDSNGNHTWYGYDDLWKPTSVTDGRGSSAGDPSHTTITAYDDADRIISKTGPIISESYECDEVGNRTKIINGRGYTTTYKYDNNNNLTKIERVVPGDSNQVIQYVYDDLNCKISETDPNGNVTSYEYDSVGRLIKETNAESNITTYTYDAQGNILSVTDGSGVTTVYEYDALNRKIHQYDELGNHWYWQYNKLGRVTKHTDATGHITRYEYDELGRLITVIDDANNLTEYEYDAVGNVTEIIDANGKFVNSRYYDNANRLISKEDGLGHAYEYAYDGVGNITSETNPNGQTKTFVYDNENRLIEIHYPDSNQVTYSYDNNGNLISMTDPTGTITYTYDALDRLTSSTDSFGKEVQYSYDIIGNRTSISYPADSTNPVRTVTYTYDKANRLDKITDWADRTWDYTVDGAGRISDVNYPSGVKELRSYDDAGRLSSLSYKDSNNVKLIGYSYTRDGQGNPLTISKTGEGILEPSVDLSFRVDYYYDDDNRLVSTTAPATYGYDNNGNLTSQVKSGTTTTFTYDFWNRLTSQTTGTNAIQHVYDGLGNRIARIGNGVETRYVLDRGRDMSHVLCETDATGEIIAYYIHGPTIVGRIAADGSQRYYQTNHIGSVVALTDENETVTDRYAYTPFGVPAGKEGSTANPFTYVGSLGVMTEADGLYFMRARFYDPDTGRFLSKDPKQGVLEYPMSLHTYSYGFNNPKVNTDPSGLFALFLGPPTSMGQFFFGEIVKTGLGRFLDIVFNPAQLLPPPAREDGSLIVPEYQLTEISAESIQLEWSAATVNQKIKGGNRK